jgi:hypothetical protein
MGEWVLIVLILVGGVLLAFPLAVGICMFLGLILMTIDRLTTRCPDCRARRMRLTNGIKETYPTGRGTGTFYRCESCQRRWFWSNDDRAWQDASAPRYDWAFGIGERGDRTGTSVVP